MVCSVALLPHIYHMSGHALPHSSTKLHTNKLFIQTVETDIRLDRHCTLYRQIHYGIVVFNAPLDTEM